ncbi:hypothetical protein GLOIN_2v1474472 [Rhizophagus irregularis DAOM 181602=DAOM 197198]|uniref:BTB domain-containing protein n=1 Tax=Rhizophagus irregularis (strain DAOM 181602 / DAOM 197198 / MUCL 43194) TaxID=747089 RepID=A0A2P4QG73_RHIID|nr:hypothetical protein GLOIN_2v1474472 [Rhizophagus irregularis DAOM 181602=DAOM 197198]POG76628.1 hypothetical protein GLOIN_2v1474472 [Rhizophagus irregularis DAOM 181602=DAOM 197198]|eukprot:XP_025183494.1 hypothetical protein GLOIN_2v1474472 [Rhizophagus irregularis DAOM 181602=DAOM 197198]
MAHLTLNKYNCNEPTQSGQGGNTLGGVLTYSYRWKITNWSEVQPFMEHTSPSFGADGLQWVFKFYKGRQKNPQALSLYLGILETTPGCLRGIRKKVGIIFVLENLRTRGMDFGKNAQPIINNPFDKLVNSPRFSDIKFRVIDSKSREKLFYAHKGILASSSSVFEAMLTNGMKETFEDEIQLCQTNHSAFLSLLKFIYTFKVNITSLCDAENLLALADRFAIVPVREECLRYFRLELNYDNVWGIWAIAEKYSCTKTSTTCRDFVALNLDTLLDKQSTLHADPNILRLALENDEANSNSEEKIYELVVRWANYSYSSDTSSPKNSTNTQVDSLSTTSSQSSSSTASMPSELPESLNENLEDSINYLIITDNSDTGTLNELNKEIDVENDEEYDIDKFPKPWRGDRLAALPSLLNCVRFPIMKKQYICEKVDGNPTIMATDGMKDLVIEAYRHHLMLELPSSVASNRVNHRRRKMKIID